MDNSVVGRLVYALARYVAIAGGVVLVVITALTIISIIGRALIRFGLAPINGIYELTEAAVFFAVFAFLPWCHLFRGHAIVGVLTDRLPVRFNVIIEAFWDLLMLGTAAFLLWRHWVGLHDKMEFRETTLLLRIPLWWVYASGMVGAVTFVIVAVYCVVRSTAAAVSRNPKMPESGYIE